MDDDRPVESPTSSRRSSSAPPTTAIAETGRCNTLIAAQAEGVLQMKCRTRTYYTDGQKALMWERWKQGWTLHQIAKLFDRAHTSVQGILGASGGIRPAERRRARVALTLAEREEISRAVVAGQSIRTVAALLGRAASTVSREIKRNGGQECYRASQADQAAWDRGHRPKICKLAQNRTLACIVTEKLRRLWSPEQIAGWLKHTYPRESHRVSHETIYRSLFIQARGALQKELLQHLRRTRGMRRSRHHTQKTDVHGQIATLVERQTRYVMLVKVAGKDTETVVDALIKNTRKLPQELYKSLTWDRGKEMAGHKRF